MNRMVRNVYLFAALTILALMGSITNLNIAYAENESKVTLSLNDVDISEAMEMISLKEQVNIVLSKDVEGEISINLFNVSLREAIISIANAAGFAVEFRNNSYFIIDREESGKYSQSGLTELRTFKVKYSDTEDVEEILETYLSEYGKITTLTNRNLLVIEDLPSFLNRIDILLKEIDQEPKQVFIEAKILEVTLRDSESYGLDWSKLFSSDGGDGSFGTRGLSNPFSPGLFFDLVTPNVEVALDYLFTRGRLRTLSTPKLLALEDQEAEVVIGDRLGFRVTTTINQVTSETIEFLESGVILRVTPSVDGQERIMLDIHPEVSTGRVEDGIPNQVTTEVTTQMLVQNGQTIFIGGLIRSSLDQNREGVPVLGELPLLRHAFSNKSESSLNTETVVLITPYIMDDHNHNFNVAEKERAEQLREELEERANKVDSKFDSASNSKSIKDPKVKEIEEDESENVVVAERRVRSRNLDCDNYSSANLSNANCY